MSAQRNERTAAKLATGARPVFVKILAAIGLLFLVAPILGILSRVHWLSLWSQLADPAVRDALILSAWTSAATTIIAVVVGVPLALLLARIRLDRGVCPRFRRPAAGSTTGGFRRCTAGATGANRPHRFAH